MVVKVLRTINLQVLTSTFKFFFILDLADGKRISLDFSRNIGDGTPANLCGSTSFKLPFARIWEHSLNLGTCSQSKWWQDRVDGHQDWRLWFPTCFQKDPNHTPPDMAATTVCSAIRLVLYHNIILFYWYHSIDIYTIRKKKSQSWLYFL